MHRGRVTFTPMLSRSTLLYSFLLGALAFRGFAAEPVPLTEGQLWHRAEQIPKMHYPKYIAFLEEKVERVYQAKLKTGDAGYRAALEKSQKAWRAFYEADLIVGAMDTEGGSGQAMFAMQRHAYQLRLRIYQLSTDFLQGWVEIPMVPEPPK